MRTRRAASRVAALMGLLAITVAPAAASPAAAPARYESAAITWTVDHAAKKITVSVNIAVFVSARPSAPAAQKALLDAAARIEADIRRKWSGLMFKCYRFVVEPHVRLASDENDIADTEVGVGLDTAVYPKGQRITGPGGASSQPVRSMVRAGILSGAATDDPFIDPSLHTGPTSLFRSVWAFFDETGVYAHEFGHLLGLPDYYIEGTGALKEGAVADLMAVHLLPVSPETVTKAIRISGQVDESTIKCPFSIDLPDTTIGLPTVVPGTAGGTIGYHAWACDYDPPSTDPNRRKPIPVTVLFRGYAGANAGPFGSVDGGGVSEYHVSIPPPAIAGRTQFVIDLGGAATVTTPLAWGSGGLTVAGQTAVTAGGGALSLSNAATVSDGAPECK